VDGNELYAFDILTTTMDKTTTIHLLDFFKILSPLKNGFFLCANVNFVWMLVDTKVWNHPHAQGLWHEREFQLFFQMHNNNTKGRY